MVYEEFEKGEKEDVYRLSSPSKQWIQMLCRSLVETDQANVQVLFNESNSSLNVETISDIEEDSLLKAAIKYFHSPPRQKPFTNSSVVMKVCPHCGIRFSSSSTLKAHVASYCTRRPVTVDKLSGGWQTRKRIAPAQPAPVSSPPPRSLSPSIGESASRGASLSHPSSMNLFASHQTQMPSLHHSVVSSLPLLLPQSSATASPSPLGFCPQCGLFFASKELYDIHVQLTREHLLSEAFGTGSALVLAAPVVTSAGIQYIPIHPRTGPMEILGSSNSASVPSGLGVNSACSTPLLFQGLPAHSQTNIDLRSTTIVANGNSAFHSQQRATSPHSQLQHSDETKPLDLRMPSELPSNGSSEHSHPSSTSPSSLSPSMVSTSVSSAKSRQLLLECPNSGCQARIPEDKLVNHLTKLCPGFSELSQQQQAAAVSRPYLCTYCTTRFQSLSTFQAHQQFYCQGRRNQQQKTQQSSNTLLPALGTATKRRRISMTTGCVTMPIGGRSSDESEELSTTVGVIGSSCGMETRWDEVSEGYRCRICGYLGQTVRGMKMHTRLHETSENADDRKLSPSNPMSPQMMEEHASNSSSHSPTPLRTQPGDDEEELIDVVESSEELRENCPPPPSGPCSQPTPPSCRSSPGLGGQTLTKKACRGCGDQFSRLDDFVRHIKFECDALARSPGGSRLGGPIAKLAIKREELSPV